MPELDPKAVERAVAGDHDALTALLGQCAGPLRERFEPQVRANARRLLDVDDVLQVTYMEAFLRVGSFIESGEGSFFAWLSAITRNNLIDAMRELDRRKRLPPAKRVVAGGGADSATELLDQLGWTTTTPSRVATQHEMKRELSAALKRLPTDYGEVVRLFDLEGLDADAVAARLGRTIGAVYMLRARALDRLREILSGVLGNSEKIA